MQTRRAFALLALTMAYDAAAQDPAAAITVYSTARPGAISPEALRAPARGLNVPGYAVIRQTRDVALAAGRNTVRFTDVAEQIDPTTVQFESLTDRAGTRVIEQSFQFDLVGTDRLLARYLDREISVDQVRGQHVETVTGTLLSILGGLVLREADGGIRTVTQHAGVRLPSLPGGLLTRPTLVWDIAARQAGTHRTRVSYQTSGMTWWTDYNVTHGEGKGGADCRLDVGAWVTLVNRSGGSYTDARLKLVAGDVHRAPAAAPRPARATAFAAPATAEAAGFEQKAFFEYHLYTLGRTTSLPDNSTRQIELFGPALGVPCEKTLVYQGQAGRYTGLPGPATDRGFGTQSNPKVDVYLRFRNAQEHGLGVPLPAGRVRVSRADPADGTLEFIGEDTIDHTPRNERLLLKMGSAFDVVGERRQLDFKLDTARRTMTEEIEVRVRNQKKDETVVVLASESLYRWTNWSITAKTHEFEKQDARTVHFPLKIAAGSEAVLRYTVQYTW